MMVKRTIIIVLCVIFALPTFFLTSCTKILGPTRVVIEDSVRHYLPVVLGDDVYMVWNVKNVGNENLVIKEIQPSNGSIELSSIGSGLIPPGGEERFFTIFHSTKNVGYAEHKIRIFGNIEPDGVAVMTFDINIVRPTLDRTDYEEVFFDTEIRNESEAFKKARLNKAYYTDADSSDYADTPTKEDSTQNYRTARDLFRTNEVNANQNKIDEGKTINFKDYPIGALDGMYRDVFFFLPRRSDVNNDNLIDEMVIWYKSNPNKTVYLKGYADKETNNSKLNKQLSDQRLKSVTSLLTRKGIPSDMIKVKSYGDSAQPFTEKSRNRCVIVEIR